MVPVPLQSGHVARPEPWQSGQAVLPLPKHFGQTRPADSPVPRQVVHFLFVATLPEPAHDLQSQMP